jgi:tetratricopeptide (TPR) repeat protein
MLLPYVVLLAVAPAPLPPEVVRGFDHFYNLEYAEAKTIFEQARELYPGDPQVDNHVAQAVLYRAMLKAGALESELVSGANAFLRRENMKPTAEEQQTFDRAIAAAMEKAKARVDAWPGDAAAQYSLAVTYGLRANYNFLVKKAWRDALSDFTDARKRAELALKADKDYIDAELVLGLNQYVVGNLPWTYKLLGFLAGFRGDKAVGISMVEHVATKGMNNKQDAQILLAAIYRRERAARKAVPLLEGLIRAYPKNYLFRMELAQMFGDLGERAKAIEVIDQVAAMQEKREMGYERVQREKVAYLKGNLLFWFDEYERAVPELRRAVEAREQLDLNTGLMACLRLGQTLDQMGRREEAAVAFRQGVELGKDTELGKECKKYLKTAYARSRIQ